MPDAVQYAGVRFFAYNEGSVVKHVPDAHVIKAWPHVMDFSFHLKEGEKVNRITSSLNRYGHLTLIAGSRQALDETFGKYGKAIEERVFMA